MLYMQDLSGGNVMLTSSPINPHGFQAKVGDFGLSREANASARLAGNVYGTITHMAPEVMLHAHIGPVSCASALCTQLVIALSLPIVWYSPCHCIVIVIVYISVQEGA